MRAEFSRQAEADLDEIAGFIARDSVDAALAWIDRLVDHANEAAAAPHAGRVVKEYADPKVREVLLKSYRIIYRVESKRIVVLTIIEGHRRLAR